MSTLLALRMPTPERTVQVSDSEGFTVRGLTPFQVFSLYERHSGELSKLFDGVMANIRANGETADSDVETVVLSLLSEAPTLLSEIVVLGSGGATANAEDFEAAYQIARTLTFPVQVDALSKISDLTFTSEMPPGKFLTLVIGLLQQVTGAISPTASPEL